MSTSLKIQIPHNISNTSQYNQYINKSKSSRAKNIKSSGKSVSSIMKKQKKNEEKNKNLNELLIEIHILNEKTIKYNELLIKKKEIDVELRKTREQRNEQINRRDKLKNILTSVNEEVNLLRQINKLTPVRSVKTSRSSFFNGITDFKVNENEDNSNFNSNTSGVDKVKNNIISKIIGNINMNMKFTSSSDKNKDMSLLNNHQSQLNNNSSNINSNTTTHTNTNIDNVNNNTKSCIEDDYLEYEKKIALLKKENIDFIEKVDMLNLTFKEKENENKELKNKLKEIEKEKNKYK